MSASVSRMQKALGLEKLSGEEVRDYLRKMSRLEGSTAGKAPLFGRENSGKPMENHNFSRENLGKPMENHNFVGKATG